MAHNMVLTMNLRCEAFASGQAFFKRFVPSQHGCLILEVRIPDINGLEIQSRLAASGAVIPLVFLVEQGSISLAVRAMRAGAVHFLEKPSREHELWDAIEEALFLDRQRRVARLHQKRIKAQTDRLTEREHRVLERFAKGMPKKQIAAELGICARTVEIRFREIMKKLSISSRTELMRFALLACNEDETAIKQSERLLVAERLQTS
jgi:two-component system response regulator FixJ